MEKFKSKKLIIFNEYICTYILKKWNVYTFSICVWMSDRF